MEQLKLAQLARKLNISYNEIVYVLGIHDIAIEAKPGFLLGSKEIRLVEKHYGNKRQSNNVIVPKIVNTKKDRRSSNNPYLKKAEAEAKKGTVSKLVKKLVVNKEIHEIAKVLKLNEEVVLNYFQSKGLKYSFNRATVIPYDIYTTSRKFFNYCYKIKDLKNNNKMVKETYLSNRNK